MGSSSSRQNSPSPRPPPPPQMIAGGANPYYIQPPPPQPTAYYQHQQPYYGPPRAGNGWWYPPTPLPPPPRAQYGPGFWYPGGGSAAVPGGSQIPAVVPLVEHQKAVKVKNGVNVHKDTIRLVVDEENPDHYLVTFVFDAVLDGCVTIHYFAREGENCRFTPYYSDMGEPNKIHFVKGPAQKFVQPSGSGIDLGFFSLEELSQPLDGVFFPLVVYAETSELPPSDEQADQPLNSSNVQITLAVIENNNGVFQIKVVKQILWVNGQRYELQEIFGLANSVEPESNSGDDDNDEGKDCVICLSEPRDTLVFPCRHMCLCSECAKELRLQSNKCPICRQPIERLMEMKVNSAES